MPGCSLICSAPSILRADGYWCILSINLTRVALEARQIGFDFYWGRDGNGRPHLKRRVSRKKLRSSIQERVTTDCRAAQGETASTDLGWIAEASISEEPGAGKICPEGSRRIARRSLSWSLP